MSAPEISVLLPVRDAAATLGAALDSTLASKDVRLELICVDDGSRDASGALLDERARRDPRVRVLHRPARGITAALGDAVAAARAPLLARMDADDELHPERLSAQLALLAARPELALVGCGIESFRAGGLRAGFDLYDRWANALVEHDAIAREAFIDCPVPHPTWLVRREWLERAGGYVERGWAEDVDLFFRLLLAGARVAKVPRVLHRWRDHDARLTRCDPRYGREALARAKAHYLPRVRPMSAAVLLGAGRTGRRFARLLAAEGVALRAVVAETPPATARSWQGIPVLGPAELARCAARWRDSGTLLLGAAALRGARPRIRELLNDLGLEEGRDFLMLA